MFTINLSFGNLKKHFAKSLTVFVLCGAMVGFLCMYLGNIQSDQNQLAALAQTMPVTGYVSNADGTMNLGLAIKSETIDALRSSDMVGDFICTVPLAANFAPETEDEKIKPKDIMMAGVNTLEAYPSVTSNEEGTFDFFGEDTGQAIASGSFLRKNGLAVGDSVLLDMYSLVYVEERYGTLYYQYLAADSLKITGSFEAAVTEGLITAPDIIVPFDWVKAVSEKNGKDFVADSASFSITDPLRLNEFKSDMKELGLVSVNPQSPDVTVTGKALVINDETFIRPASNVQNDLLMLQLFLPFLVALVFVIGYVVSSLMVQSRREEFAVMRALGMGKASCFGVYLAESAVLALCGTIGGVLVSVLFLEVGLFSVLLAGAGFFIAYMLGTCVAVAMLGRVNVILLLCRAD